MAQGVGSRRRLRPNLLLSAEQIAAGLGFNLMFINVYGQGQAYTEQEHKDWLEEAGFGDFERIILPDERSVITARKTK